MDVSCGWRARFFLLLFSSLFLSYYFLDPLVISLRYRDVMLSDLVRVRRLVSCYGREPGGIRSYFRPCPSMTTAGGFELATWDGPTFSSHQGQAGGGPKEVAQNRKWSYLNVAAAGGHQKNQLQNALQP